MHSRGVAALIATICMSVIVAACGGSSKHATPPRETSRPSTTRAVVTTTALPASTATTTTPPPETTAPATTPPATTPAATTAAATAPPPPPASLLVTRLSSIGSAQQVVTVATNGYRTSSASVTAYERGASGWKQVYGPWFAYVGRNGVAPIGAKREGDGRTPSGTYGFDFMFGVSSDPGVHFPFRRITGSNIVWDDDSNSANYNEWIDTNTASAGATPEPMYNTPSYYYGAVIAYNDSRTPGLGSAIFLHVSHGSPTAGCVALPTEQLLALLRWLDPARSPRIAIGTLAALSR